MKEYRLTVARDAQPKPESRWPVRVQAEQLADGTWVLFDISQAPIGRMTDVEFRQTYQATP